jgi:poly(hydroxyalkanoate) granule-associated protein
MTKTLNSAPDREDLFNQLKGVAERLRLAGLGAVSTVQRKGGSLLASLIEEGKQLEATFNPSASRALAAPPPRKHLTPQQLQQLEDLFQERVARVLQRLQVPTLQEVQELRRQMDALAKTIKRLSKKSER